MTGAMVQTISHEALIKQCVESWLDIQLIESGTAEFTVRMNCIINKHNCL